MRPDVAQPLHRTAVFLAALLLAGLFGGMFAAGGLRAQGYVPGIADLPLMPALVSTAGGGLVFDTPSGRIVESLAAGPVTRRGVLDFYAQALPQLGWTAAGPAVYRREKEVLKIEFKAAGEGGVSVLFSLLPATEKN